MRSTPNPGRSERNCVTQTPKTKSDSTPLGPGPTRTDPGRPFFGPEEPDEEEPADPKGWHYLASLAWVREIEAFAADIAEESEEAGVELVEDYRPNIARIAFALAKSTLDVLREHPGIVYRDPSVALHDQDWESYVREPGWDQEELETGQ